MEQRYSVTVRETGDVFSCAGDEAVLRAMIHAGLGPIRHGCCGGGCGVCKMQVVDGKWEIFKAMSRAHISEEDEKKGILLLCCVHPRSNLTVARIN
ncbi:MAG: 2Fe-2S iron-sulfur cluster binding domain-containing protein [Spirochaetaceae bacterium]|jgi:ferredoxin|nr:2Fe-2S iron-sulfur cluster binding domain-containing protein [Spirochaetaceae bacterium]